MCIILKILAVQFFLHATLSSLTTTRQNECLTSIWIFNRVCSMESTIPNRENSYYGAASTYLGTWRVGFTRISFRVGSVKRGFTLCLGRKLRTAISPYAVRVCTLLRRASTKCDNKVSATRLSHDLKGLVCARQISSRAVLYTVLWPFHAIIIKEHYVFQNIHHVKLLAKEINSAACCLLRHWFLRRHGIFILVLSSLLRFLYLFWIEVAVCRHSTILLRWSWGWDASPLWFPVSSSWSRARCRHPH